VLAAGRSIDKLKIRFDRWLTSPLFHLVKYDALKSVVLSEKIDYVIHGASNSNPNSYLSQPVETMLINILGVNNLLDYLHKQGFGRFLYISSSEVYGKRSQFEPYQEDENFYVDLLNPRSCYPSSKRACETLCISYLKEHMVDSVIVRPGHVYGPTVTDFDNRASSQFPKDLAIGKNIIMKSSGLQRRSYCYVIDCASAILTVLLNGQSGNAYNISNSNSIVSIREMAEIFASVSGKKVVFENPTDSEKSSYNMMDDSVLNSDKLESLGWKGKFDMTAGAERTLNALQVNLKQDD